jgi:hypothetical protein
MMPRLFPAVLLCVFVTGVLRAQIPPDEPPFGTGESAAAERYAVWAEDAIARGRWPEALASLEAAADYAAVSSDLSWLLALARDHEKKPRGAVLEALGRAFEAGRWSRYSAAAARLLEAETLIALRNFSGALQSLSRVPESPREAELRLLALKGSDINEFRRFMGIYLDRYPRDPRIVRVLFEYAQGHNPEGSEEALVSLALRRLPLLLDEDPALAYLAVPFMRDTEEARRLLSAYRALPRGGPNAGPGPARASIPASLTLGLVGEQEAVEELFGADMAGTAEKVIDRELLLSVWGLLRNGEGRGHFSRNLLSFSGVITEDRDRDGYAEIRVRYREGEIQTFYYDADQDRLDELTVVFSGGNPGSALQALLPDGEGQFAFPVREGDRSIASVIWEQYPAVLMTGLEGTAYIPRPLDFMFKPLRFVELCGGGSWGGLLYPEPEEVYPRISRRSLVSFSIQIQRPSEEFRGARELVDLDRGIPRRALEVYGGRVVSITDFEQGRPVTERIDLDLDGRMETLRRFKKTRPPAQGGDEDLLDFRKEIEFVSSDWNGDGIDETAGEFLSDGLNQYYWDMDRDAARNYSENRTEE